MQPKRSPSSTGLLQGARVYLSGPMDFVASREKEKRFGWRNRIGEFLRSFGVTVFDPWNKPDVRGLHEYGREEVDMEELRRSWTFENTARGAGARAKCSGRFWESMHIDLRMVDTSDFVVAYCPTNVYSVGTPHEIVVCRQQKKPVLFVSPRVLFPSLAKLKERLRADAEGTKLLAQVVEEVPIKENPAGTPSFWYMPLVGGESFFDGFGFAPFRDRFGWPETDLDRRETASGLKKPLLVFLKNLNDALPEKWDNRGKKFTRNDDWLLWDFRKKKGGGWEISGMPPETQDKNRERSGCRK